MKRENSFQRLLAGIAVCLSITVSSAFSQCPDTGETKVIKPHEGTGYHFYRLIGSKSFHYFLDGGKFSMADKSESGRNYFFIDQMAFEVVLADKADFKKFIQKESPEGLLVAQAKYEQEYFKKRMASVHITDLGSQWRVKKDGSPDRVFHLWKKQNSVNDPEGLQYLLSTPLDGDVVVVLSIVPLQGTTESAVFGQVSKYTSHFELMSSDQCKQLLTSP